MKILHIMGKKLDKGDGISTSVTPFIEEQNKIPGVESKLLIAKNISDLSERQFKFDLLDIRNIEQIMNDAYKPDLVIFHEIYYLSFVKLYKILKRKNIPYIIKPHGSLKILSQKHKKLKKKIGNIFLFDRFIKTSHAISFLNEGEHRDSIFKCKDYIIVNNGLQIENRCMTKRVNSGIKIIFLSRIDFKFKGLDFLLEGIKLISNEEFIKKNFNLIIYGNGEEKDIKKLKFILSSINNEYVDYRGPVYEKEKNEALEDSNIFILTSRSEGMPMVILEALAHGLPCIVTEETNVADDIIQNGSGWVTTTGPSEIKKTILKAVSDYSNNKEEYIKNSLSLVKNKYDAKKTAEDSIVEYKKIISKYR